MCQLLRNLAITHASNFHVSLVISHYLMLEYYFIIYSSGDKFEEIIFPEGDPDAVSISKRDVDLLKPKTFVNDTIIDFYIM